jgi:HEAT repeats
MQPRRVRKVRRLRPSLRSLTQTVDPKKYGAAGVRVLIDEMLEARHGRPAKDWERLGAAGRQILYLIASGEETHPFRNRSIAVLGFLKDAGSLSYLGRILANRHEDRIVRMVAARAIGDVGVGSASQILLENLPDPDPPLRHKIVQALGKIGDTRTMSQLHKLASNDASDLVRQAAINALQRISIIHKLNLQ